MRGSDFLSRTEADQNPEDLRRKRRETGEGRREGVSEEGEGGSTEGGKKKKKRGCRKEGNYRQIDASHGQQGSQRRREVGKERRRRRRLSN